MAMRSLEQIDHEIDTRQAELNSLSTALVELESHDGLEHVRQYPPTGVTARRWKVAEAAIAQMWEHLRHATTILDSVRAVRERALGRGEPGVTELNRLLHDRPLAVAPDGSVQIWSAEAAWDGAVEFVGLDGAAVAIRTLFPTVVEFLCAVDEIADQVATGLAPHINRLDEMGFPIPAEITDLLAVSACDPLALTADQVGTRISAIAEGVSRLSADAAEDAALQANWPSAVADTRRQLEDLHQLLEHAADARRRAESTVATSRLPAPAVDEQDLRSRLDVLTDADPAALRALRGAIEDGVRLAHENAALATALLDRRTELRGRLKIYAAKAARLGFGEDRDVLNSGGVAAGLLSRRPCDLGAATRAVADYQKLITEKRGPR